MSTSARAERHLVLAAPGDAAAQPGDDLEHRVDVADARDVAEAQLRVGQHRGRDQRERAVLVARRDDGAGERRAAVDDEAVHACGGSLTAPARGDERASSEASRRTDVLQVALQLFAARVRSIEPFTVRDRRGRIGRSIRRPAHHTNTCSGAPVLTDLVPRRPARARPRPRRPAPRACARGAPRARRGARGPPAPHAAARSSRAPARRGGAGPPAALHHPAGPGDAARSRARTPPLTLGGRLAAQRRAAAGTRAWSRRRAGVCRKCREPHSRGARHASEKNRRRPTLPGPCGPSTIGAEGLNCSVRNGKRCFPLAIATGSFARPPPAILQNCTAPRQRVITKLSVKPSTH